MEVEVKQIVVVKQLFRLEMKKQKQLIMLEGVAVQLIMLEGVAVQLIKQLEDVEQHMEGVEVLKQLEGMEVLKQLSMREGVA